jgi:prevent-host-death family protein
MMRTINIHEAKTQLSKLVERAVLGDPFIIAKSGKPMVRVTRIDSPMACVPKRIGFMGTNVSVPDDFNTMGAAQIEAMFAG